MQFKSTHCGIAVSAGRLPRRDTRSRGNGGVPIHVIEKLLNHVSGSSGGIVSVYNRNQYLPEMRVMLLSGTRLGSHASR